MKIQEYLQKYSVSQVKFSKMIGVSQSHVNNIMNGKKNPSIQLINVIIEVTKGKITAKDLIHPEAPSRLKKRPKEE